METTNLINMNARTQNLYNVHRSVQSVRCERTNQTEHTEPQTTNCLYCKRPDSIGAFYFCSVRSMFKWIKSTTTTTEKKTKLLTYMGSIRYSVWMQCVDYVSVTRNWNKVKRSQTNSIVKHKTQIILLSTHNFRFVQLTFILSAFQPKWGPYPFNSSLILYD